MNKLKTAGISEIFSSLQGEGTHLGERHLFVRFEHCNIHCEYCDELGKVGQALDLSEVIAQIKETDLSDGPHDYISLTGGEPLLYSSFIKELIYELKLFNFKFYLETNGILWKPLNELIAQIDVVAMDLKPASVTKERKFKEEHQRFLEIAAKKEVFCKMVISKEIDISEYEELCELVRQIRSDIPLILQPVSSERCEGHEDFQLMSLLDQLQRIGKGILKNVRIVPRLHRILNIR